MKVCFKHLSVFFILLVPFFLGAISDQEVASFPEPWALKDGWWRNFIEKYEKSTPTEKELSLSSLRNVEQMVPQGNRDYVKNAAQAIETNLERYLIVRSTQGFIIDSKEEIEETYSIDQFLELAKEVRNARVKRSDKRDEQRRLQLIEEQLSKQLDRLYDEYVLAPEQSLERTTIGLSLMLTVTNRAIVREKRRVVSESLSSLEKSIRWYKEALISAEKKFSPDGLNKEELEEQILGILSKKDNYEEKLILTETEVSEQSSEHSLNRLIMHIKYAKIKLDLVTVNLKSCILSLSKDQVGPNIAEDILDKCESWSDFLTELEQQIQSWEKLIRREQQLLERAYIGSNHDDGSINQIEKRVKSEEISTVNESLTELFDLESKLFQANQLSKLLTRKAVTELDWMSGYKSRISLTMQSLYSFLSSTFSYPLFSLHEKSVTLFKLLRALCIFIFAYFISILLRRMLTELVRHKPKVSLSSLFTLKRVMHYTILLLGFVWALSSIGIDFSSLLIIAGALSVGIGFGLQGIVNNFIGGIVLLFDRKLRIGDFIELSGGETGHITEVNIQNTVIRTLNGHDILVPNSDIITRQLSNWTLRDQFARFHIQFGVAYGSDKEKVKEVVQKAALFIDETVSGHKSLPDPTVWLVGFGDSSLDFELVVWVDLRKGKRRQSSIRASYYWEIETALRENEIVIPFPQRDVHHKDGLAKPSKNVK